MYKTFLSNHGYLVESAYNGEEGLQKALQEHPDIILLDIRMPKMDGITMLSQLRKDAWGEDAKVIILTNLDQNENILKGVVTDHPSYYLIKANIKPKTLIDYITMIFDEQQKEDQQKKEPWQKILIIEDDEILVRMYTQLLTGKQYNVVSAHDGKTGLILAQSEKPDLILLDIMLPGGMNGFDVLEKLKQDNKSRSIPVLVLTNLDSEEKTAREMGAQYYLIKADNPPEKVLEIIRELLDTSIRNGENTSH